MSHSLQPHELQHTRPPCPSPTPGVHPNSCPSSQWCHPAISSSVVPFSSCPQSLPASVFSNESTLCMRCPKYWSFSFSIVPSKEHPGLISFRMDWLDLLAVQGTLPVASFYYLVTTGLGANHIFSQGSGSDSSSFLEFYKERNSQPDSGLIFQYTVSLVLPYDCLFSTKFIVSCLQMFQSTHFLNFWLYFPYSPEHIRSCVN